MLLQRLLLSYVAILCRGVSSINRSRRNRWRLKARLTHRLLGRAISVLSFS